jgi:hypothetical protein
MMYLHMTLITSSHTTESPQQRFKILFEFAQLNSTVNGADQAPNPSTVID